MNLVYGNKPRRLFLLVDPTDPAVRTHIGLQGAIEVLPTLAASTGYHNALNAEASTEDLIERYRSQEVPIYPPRSRAIFAFDRIDDAWGYADTLPAKTAKRILKVAETDGTYLMSLHDASWINLLRSHRAIPAELVQMACESYWRGETLLSKASQLGQHGGRRVPVLQALYFGRLVFPNRQFDKADIARPAGRRPLPAEAEETPVDD